MTLSDRTAITAQVTQFVPHLGTPIALYSGARPHTSKAIPFFGGAPFLGASISMDVSDLLLGPRPRGVGRMRSVATAPAAMASLGAHKYMVPQITRIDQAVRAAGMGMSQASAKTDAQKS